MKRKLPLLVLVLLLIPSSSSASILFSPKPVDLGFQNVQQETENWCWAAIVQQILMWRGNSNPPSQCELVSEANRDRGSGGANCCDQGGDLPGGCNRGGTQLEIMSLINRYGGRVDGIQMPDTPEQVHEYLAAGRALAVGIKTNSDLGHIFLIRGIYWENGQAILRINDPSMTESTTISFESSRPDWQITQTISR